MEQTLEIVGKQTGDYFQIQCADCGSPTVNLYCGWDPAVPVFTATCERCEKKGTWKLDIRLWQGLPPTPHKPST